MMNENLNTLLPKKCLKLCSVLIKCSIDKGHQWRISLIYIQYGLRNKERIVNERGVVDGWEDDAYQWFD